MAPKKDRLVVVGGVAAGMSAASAAKRIRPDMEVIVFEKSPFISYGACSIPYYVSDEIKDYRDLIAVTPDAAEKERSLVVRTLHEVTSILPDQKEVLVRSVDKGKEELTVELLEAMVPIPVTVKGDYVRIIEKKS